VDSEASVLNQVKVLESLYKQLLIISPPALPIVEPNYKLVVFELNANSHDIHRALANALAIGRMERLGQTIRMVTSANALQPHEQNDDVWDQGLLFFNPGQIWAQPPYYVTQMKARNYLPVAIDARVSGREIDTFTFHVTATRSADGRTLALHVVNTIDVFRTYEFRLNGFEPRHPSAHVTTLAGARGARNTSSNPYAIAPWEADIPYKRVGNTITLTFAPNSFTIVKLQ